MTVLYVASDREGAGKTTLCATLAWRMARRGKKPAVFKPLVAAGPDPISDQDATIYTKLLPALGLPEDETSLGWPVKLPADGLTADVLDRIKAASDRFSDGADAVLVEGSCALSVEESARIAAALDADVLVVVRYQRDLSAAQLRQWRDLLNGRLVGFLINGRTRHLGTEAASGLLPAMESDGLVSLGIVPEDRRLLGVTLAQLAEHLDGRFVVNPSDDGTLVEHLMVGGRSTDPGHLYFGLRENKAVIVRGDRPDVQMPALTTPTACMVLTAGVDPIEYVKYEAEQEEVPIMVVPGETLDTMDALNTLIDRARFDHPLKLSRYSDMLDQHADMPALCARLGLES